jgi:predicted esterase
VTEGHLAVTRRARFVSLGPAAADARALWIALHGYAQLAARFLREWEPIVDGSTLIVAPEALSRFYLETARDGRHADRIGASWLTREDRESEIADTVGYLDSLVDHLCAGLPSAPPIGILGFSQGGAAAVRWVARGRVRPARLVLWGSALPADVPPAAIAAKGTPLDVVLVAGRSDPFVAEAAVSAQSDALAAAGARIRVERFEGAHTLDTATLRRVTEGLT